MLQIRDIVNPFEREIELEDGTMSTEWITKELYYTSGRERAKPCSDGIDIVEANRSMLIQCADNKKTLSMPEIVYYGMHEYKVCDSTKSMLRDKIDIYEEGELFNCECNKGLVQINIEDARLIRRQMEEEEQVIISKHKSVMEMISSFETIEEVESFSLDNEWILN